MIQHLFPGRAEHHIPAMIQFFMTIHEKLSTPIEEHGFAFYGATPAQLEKYASGLPPACRVVSLQKGKYGLFRYLRQLPAEDSLILHSAFYPLIWLMLLGLPRRWKRTSWVMWGADIYGNDTWRGRVYRLIKGFVVRRLGAVSALIPGDFSDLQRLIGPCDNYIRAFYAPDFEAIPCPAEEPSILKHDHVTRVIVGNSAWEQSDHIPVLQWLSRFKDREIEVICPLGYPKESAYKSAVIAAGREVLGEKFRPLQDMLGWNEYHALLSTCDILVLNSQNQQGLGNIYYMLLCGGKVYLRGDSATYRMLKELGLHVYDSRRIQDLSYGELIEFSKEQAGHNRAQYQKHLSTEASIEGWKSLLHKIGVLPVAA